MNYNKLSADPTALILGIIAFVIMILGFCCGFVVFVSLILGVVGLVLSIKQIQQFIHTKADKMYMLEKLFVW